MDKPQSQTFLEVDYAKSGRSKCRGCGQIIEQGSIRMSQSYQGPNMSSQPWRHLDCMKLGKRYLELDAKQIQGIDNLRPKDRQLVEKRMKLVQKNGGKAYLARPSSRKTSKEPAKKAKSKAPKAASYKTRQKSNEQPLRVRRKKIVKSYDRFVQLVTQAKPPTKRVQALKDRVHPMKTRAMERQQHRDASNTTDSQSVEPKKKQTTKTNRQKKKIAKSKPKKFSKAKDRLFQEYTEEYLSMTNEQLKSILEANKTSKTGNKEQLAQRCADGRMLGKIPRCPKCGGGRPRFDRRNQNYKCPGYMDDDKFRRCGKMFEFEQLRREEWIS